MSEIGMILQTWFAAIGMYEVTLHICRYVRDRNDLRAGRLYKGKGWSIRSSDLNYVERVKRIMEEREK